MARSVRLGDLEDWLCGFLWCPCSPSEQGGFHLPGPYLSSTAPRLNSVGLRVLLDETAVRPTSAASGPLSYIDEGACVRTMRVRA